MTPTSDLHAREQWFAKIFEAAPLAVFLVDLAGTIVEENAAARCLAGYGSGKLAGSHLASLVHPHEREEDARLTSRLIAGEMQRYKVERRLVTRSGQTVTCSVTAALITEDRGAPSHVVLVVEDITDRKADEDRTSQRAVAEAVLSALTERETEILHLALKGLNSRDMSDHLLLSIRTVESHLARAYRKLGVSDRQAAAERFECLEQALY